MKKIPTLFIREFEDHKIVKVLEQVTPGCEWVLKGEGIALEKLDGTCTWFHEGHMWKRYDAKHGKPVPKDAIKCQEEADPITGHLPCWVPVYADDPSDRWFVVAYKEQLNRGYEFIEGHTYELVGKHFRGNPYSMDNDVYFDHTMTSPVMGEDTFKFEARTYEGIKTYLQQHNIEGIVFHRGNGEMCKIKRSDFGFPWNPAKKRG